MRVSLLPSDVRVRDPNVGICAAFKHTVPRPFNLDGISVLVFAINVTRGGSNPSRFHDLTPRHPQAYRSSSGVVREFCDRCGATVFWHDGDRPELIDVSVGLLDAAEGARAESWLELEGQERWRSGQGAWLEVWKGVWGVEKEW
ncbi:Uu.00g110110.m01.CDS01 [Anthostomella pinea]|uniref:Uu.00g110110.m01.CDS01 n=1 Tax=Anthostomella pinea TaxID=933095 RepID=A0AAI8VEV0_9PEZI|nr:Uu.00g110110.m01.CDS01 [Anthostomella pinea]